MERGSRLVVVVIVVAALGGGARWELGRVSASDQVTDALPRKYPNGVLMVCGGGAMPLEVRDHFIALAGGREANLLVIPTGNRTFDLATPAQRDSYLEPWRARGVSSVRLWHAKSRTEADSLGFASQVDSATGVWISGGFQSKLAEVYRGTEVERRMASLLSRGGVIGGTSAGAGVMTHVMIESGRTEAVLSEGLDLLPGAVVDQHFLRRNRMGRLLGVVKNHAGLVGLGIDESTALVVDLRTRKARVEGKSYVVACIADPPAQPADDPSLIPIRTESLKAGDEIDLPAFAAHDARAIAAAVDVDAN